jgi:hypothetical protein
MARSPLTILLAAVLAFCGDAARAGEKDLPTQAAGILRKHCGRCHGPGGTNEGGFNFVLDVKQLVDRKRVVTGEPEKSKLMKRIFSGEMPPEDEKLRPSKDEVKVLEDWIKAGAKPFADELAQRRFVDLKDTLTAIKAHLLYLQREDRPFQRYYTLTHLSNNPKISDADLRLYRAALAKLVNSFSWKAAVVVPQAVDAEQTVFAVDLRKLDWDRYNLWDEVLKVYPYGLKYDRDADPVIQELAKQVYEYAGNDLPMVRADWFVAAASQPKLYHTLLRLPNNAYDLEKLLKVDVNANFLRDQIARAGFSTSGVSSQNRLVERHDAAYGAYWKSYDFKSDEGKRNLFRNPLGPAFRGNPYLEVAFEHDGGELIFNLPNGLQGYMLTNNKGERIDEGPIEIVADSLRTSGTAKVVNGVSCFACHAQGMQREFKDTMRDNSSVEGKPRDKVRRLHPLPAEMDKLLEEDRARFLQAYDRVSGPFLKVGLDKDKKIEDFTAEPVGTLARWFLLRELKLEDVAFELGFKDGQRLAGAFQANERLRQLGLGPLAKDATIKRAAWESLDGFISPFQEAASVLQIGVPKRVR